MELDCSAVEESIVQKDDNGSYQDDERDPLEPWNSPRKTRGSPQKTTTKAGVWECKLCPYSTKNIKKYNCKAVIIRHYKAVHTNIRDYKCDQCPKEFTQKGHLDNHRKVVHEGLKDHKCDQCGHLFSQKKSLKNHKKAVHDKIKDNVCEECGYSTAKRSNLLHHKKIRHLKLKDFKCDECDFASSRKESLQLHRRSIHNDRTTEDYKCDLCDYSALEKRRLKVHKKAVHDKIKDQVCDCGYASSYRKNLLRHKRVVHQNIKNVKCKVCAFACKGKRALNAHYKQIHHRNEDVDSSFIDASIIEAATNRAIKKKMEKLIDTSTTTENEGNTPKIKENSENCGQPKNKLKSPTRSTAKATQISKSGDISNKGPKFPWILPDEHVHVDIEPSNVIKESDVGAIMKLDNNLTMNQHTVRRNSTNGVILVDNFPLNGIEGKIASVGNWLNKLKGKRYQL